MYKPFIVLSTLLLCQGCGESCATFANREYRPVEYNFVVRDKHTEEIRYNVIEGTNTKGKTEIFRQAGFDKMYDLAAPGDTLRKKAGDLTTYLIKKDRIFKFPYQCGGVSIY
ncbi:hypothetical protein PV783_12525 [Chitinophaga sp. CC14]|uniref:hypothetical protein n=1 Tax=Chitinophaga sp. CC14 TaxID=3029199 RepID=UPI003B7D7861